MQAIHAGAHDISAQLITVHNAIDTLDAMPAANDANTRRGSRWNRA